MDEQTRRRLANFIDNVELILTCQETDCNGECTDYSNRLSDLIVEWTWHADDVAATTD